jgi:hypothetical protein
MRYLYSECFLHRPERPFVTVSQVSQSGSRELSETRFMALTYVYSAGDLPEVIDEHLAELPGG